jgi:hypothetical protein
MLDVLSICYAQVVVAKLEEGGRRGTRDDDADNAGINLIRQAARSPLFYDNIPLSASNDISSYVEPSLESCELETGI